MNAEKTDLSSGIDSRGWVFYDASCPFCVRGVERCGRLFARRGFAWVPLQTPGTPRRLGLTEAELLAEMKLLRRDGRISGGIDAWSVLLRKVWWLWPVGVLLSLPGFHPIASRAYRWLARNRYCWGGACRLDGRRVHRAATTFLEMP